MTDVGWPPEHAPVYVISVAAALSGLHPQTLRQYDRLGLVTPGRASGGGRRYSAHDIAQLREVTRLTGMGIGLDGVKRVIELEDQVLALRLRVQELEAEVDGVRALARRVFAAGPQGDVVAMARGQRARRPDPGAALVVWRPGR